MLQIIGWMGCLYLVVKALEILSSNEHQTEGKFHGTAQAAAVLAILGAIGFFFLLQAQVDATTSIFPDFGLGSSDYDDAAAAADAAMADAEASNAAAIEEAEVNIRAAEAAVEDVAAEAGAEADAAAAEADLYSTEMDE